MSVLAKFNGFIISHLVVKHSWTPDQRLQTSHFSRLVSCIKLGAYILKVQLLAVSMGQILPYSSDYFGSIDFSTRVKDNYFPWTGDKSLDFSFNGRFNWPNYLVNLIFNKIDSL